MCTLGKDCGSRIADGWPKEDKYVFCLQTWPHDIDFTGVVTGRASFKLKPVSIVCMTLIVFQFLEIKYNFQCVRYRFNF